MEFSLHLSLLLLLDGLTLKRPKLIWMRPSHAAGDIVMSRPHNFQNRRRSIGVTATVFTIPWNSRESLELVVIKHIASYE